MKLRNSVIMSAVVFAAALGSSNVVTRVLAGAQPGAPATKTATAPLGTPDNPRVIQITAHRFEFVPNEITIKKGETVKIELTTTDVQHGFYIRGLKVDEKIEPGKQTEVLLTPQTAGAFPTICDHFCGLGHNKMKMTVVVEE
jgi:cytochrome c oxidase subunit II